MSDKIRVGIIFGGKSAEHEVSLQSAKNIVDALDENKYEVILIGIDKKGKWYLNEDSVFLLNENNPKLIQLNTSNNEVAFVPGQKSHQLINASNSKSLGDIDVLFPVLHGTYGEDGTIQGMLKIANIPFVGAGVLVSAIGMDKDVSKRLLRDAGISIAKFLVFNRISQHNINFKKVSEALGMPVFVKPANLGSSVGISKVTKPEELEKAVENAFRYDNKIIIEENVSGREIECSVLGNDNPIVSIPGEILAQHDFYSYEAKYIDENGAVLEIPAKLSEDDIKRIQNCAVKAFKTLCCEGMARVDFFLKKDGEIVVNEINTMPGFTRISMYPKLWGVSGIHYSELIDRLIHLAIERFEREQQLKTSVN